MDSSLSRDAHLTPTCQYTRLPVHYIPQSSPPPYEREPSHLHTPAHIAAGSMSASPTPPPVFPGMAPPPYTARPPNRPPKMWLTVQQVVEERANSSINGAEDGVDAFDNPWKTLVNSAKLLEHRAKAFERAFRVRMKAFHRACKNYTRASSMKVAASPPQLPPATVVWTEGDPRDDMRVV